MSTKTVQFTDSNGDVVLPESAESGSGYIKLADGTLICYGSVTKNVSPFLWVTPLYLVQIREEISFAKEFISTPILTLTCSTYWTANCSCSASAITSVDVTYPGTFSQVSFGYIAIGRWK